MIPNYGDYGSLVIKVWTMTVLRNIQTRTSSFSESRNEESESQT